MSSGIKIKGISTPVQMDNELLKTMVDFAIVAGVLIPPFIKTLKKIAEAIQPAMAKAALAFIEWVDTEQLKSELLRNYWIIMDEKLLKLLKDSNKRNIHDIGQIIIDYYKENNFSNLKELFEPYRKNITFTNRFPIIDSCITVLKDNPLEISSYVVIPTLLSQITGIYDVFPKLVPEQQKKEIKKQLNENSKKIICPLSTDGKKPSNCEFVVQGNAKINKDIFERYMMEKVSYSVYYNYKEVIANTFKNGKQVDKIQDDMRKKGVFRHKILHGIDLQYNSAENVVKCFMELAFLMKMYTQLSEENADD